MNETKTSRANSAGPRKPYTPPRLVSYGHVKDVIQTGGGGMNDGTDTSKTMCWVAEALYGASDARTLALRSWLTGIHAARRRGWVFVELYPSVRPACRRVDRRRADSARRAAAVVRCPRRPGVRRVGTDDCPWAASSGCLIWTAGLPISTTCSVLSQPPVDRRRAAPVSGPRRPWASDIATAGRQRRRSRSSPRAASPSLSMAGSTTGRSWRPPYPPVDRHRRSSPPMPPT